MRTIFKFIHPLLPITLGLFGIAAILLQGQGGPCASPAILILPVLLFGVFVGLILSVVQTIVCIRKRADTDKAESK